MRRLAVGTVLLLALAACIVYFLRSGRGDAKAGRAAPTILRVANWGGPSVDPSFLKQEREILDEFERAHPDIQVRIENIPGPGQYVPKLLMTYVAGNPPDVIALDASSAAVFIDNDLLADLMPLVRGDSSFDLKSYFPNVVDIARRGESLFAIPSDFTPMVVLYNKRLFDQAKVPYPREGWLREEFLATALVLKGDRDLSPPAQIPRSASKVPVPFAFVLQKDMPMWFPWIWAGGGDVLSGDGRHALGYLDSPANIDTIQFLVDLTKKHKVAPTLSAAAASGVDLFRAGRAAMTMTGHWSLIEYRADHMDIGVASVPSVGGRRVTVMYEAGLAISRSSPHQRAAWEYIKHMTGASVQRRHIASGLAISAHREVACGAGFQPATAATSQAGSLHHNTSQAGSLHHNEVEDAFLAEVKHARQPWGSRCERYELVEDLGREMIEDILNGDVPVKEALARTAALVEAELRRQ